MRTATTHRTALLSWFALAAAAAVVVPGSHTWSGPVLLVLTAGHGVHLLDLAVLAAGLLVLLRSQALLAALARALVTSCARFHPNGWWVAGGARPITSS